MLASFCDAPGWETVWADEFDGARLDGSKWGAVVSDAMPQARMPRFGAATPHADCRGLDDSQSTWSPQSASIQSDSKQR